MNDLKPRYQIGNIVLAHECPECTLIKNAITCERCGGNGFVLTQDGLELLALVRDMFHNEWK